MRTNCTATSKTVDGFVPLDLAWKSFHLACVPAERDHDVGCWALRDLQVRILVLKKQTERVGDRRQAGQEQEEKAGNCQDTPSKKKAKRDQQQRKAQGHDEDWEELAEFEERFCHSGRIARSKCRTGDQCCALREFDERACTSN